MERIIERSFYSGKIGGIQRHSIDMAITVPIYTCLIALAKAK